MNYFTERRNKELFSQNNYLSSRLRDLGVPTSAFVAAFRFRSGLSTGASSSTNRLFPPPSGRPRALVTGTTGATSSETSRDICHLYKTTSIEWMHCNASTAWVHNVPLCPNVVCKIFQRFIDIFMVSKTFLMVCSINLLIRHGV